MLICVQQKKKTNTGFFSYRFATTWLRE